VSRWLLAIAAAWLALVPGMAFGHEGQPAVVREVQAGPYPLIVELFGTLRAGQPLPMRIIPTGTPPRRIEVIMRPTDGTAATPSPATVTADPDQPGAFAAEPTVLVSGAWEIDIRALGEAGEGSVRVPLDLAGPAEIPLWLGWAIGLTPLLGLGAFAAWQARWLRRNALVSGGGGV
jgi:hypothetical protein